MYFHTCPRCGDASYEHLPSHSHCFNCNYSPEYEQNYDFEIHHYHHIDEFEPDENGGEM